jgi:hypothetical protein
MRHGFTESIVEEAALAWLESLGWFVVHGPEIAPDQPGAERRDYSQVVLEGRLRQALVRAAVSDEVIDIFAAAGLKKPDISILSVTIDWTVRENVRARLRVLVKRILRKYGYPPDKQEKATQTVLEQAEVLSRVWAGNVGGEGTSPMVFA